MSAVVLSLALYGAAEWGQFAGLLPASDEASYVVPVFAVMIAAVGIGWRRKLAFLALTVAGFALIELVGGLTGAASFAPRRVVPAGTAALVVGVTYSALVFAFPMAMLALFVGKRPTLLWSRK